MKRIVTILPILSLLFVVPAAAVDHILIGVPGLVGTVTPSDGISASVYLPGGSHSVLSVRLTLSGTATEGTIQFEGDPELYPAPVYVGAYFSNDCIDNVPGYFHAEFHEIEGEGGFQSPVFWFPFEGDPEPWSCWNGEWLSISLEWDIQYPGIYDFIDLPSFEITYAYLLLQVEEATPVESGSWGAVKALYR